MLIGALPQTLFYDGSAAPEGAPPRRHEEFKGMTRTKRSYGNKYTVADIRSSIKHSETVDNHAN